MGRSALVGAAVAVERGCSDTEGANVQVVVSSAGERGPRVSGFGFRAARAPLLDSDAIAVWQIRRVRPRTLGHPPAGDGMSSSGSAPGSRE